MRSTVTFSKSNFFKAIYENDAITVEHYIVNRYVDLNVGDEERNETGLMAAARRGNLDVVKVFLKHGVPVDQAKETKAKYERVTSLCLAANNGYVDVVKELLRAGADVNYASNRGRAPLFFAAISGQVDAVKTLLKNKADFNKANIYDETPLTAAADLSDEIVKVLNGYSAAKSNYEEIVTCLLEAKLNWLLQEANANDVTDAILKELKPYKKQLFTLIKNLPLVEQKKAANAIFDLSKSKKKNMTTAIGKVMCQGGSDVTKPDTQLGGIYQECIKLKLFATEEDEKKERINEFFKAVYANDANAVEQYIIDHYVDLTVVDEKMDTGLMAAARRGYLGVMKVFLKYGVPVDRANFYGLTAIFYAVQGGYLDVVNELLAGGAAVDQVPVYVDTTLLMTAASCGYFGIVNLLISHGADVNKTSDDGATALQLASLFGHLAIVNALLQTDGVKVDLVHRYGGTPISYAAYSGHLDVVNALLAKGAEAKARNDGATPLGSAAKAGHVDIVACLIEPTLIWLLKADASAVTDLTAKELKPYKKQLFEFIKKLPTLEEKKQAASAMFDMSKVDKKNMTTALGKVMCQGGSDVTRAATQLGGIYKECLALGLIEPTKQSEHLQLSVFAKSKEADAPDMAVEKITESEVFSVYGDKQL